LAELKHDLWCEERQRQSWRFGTPRHDGRKIQSLLIPYVELPENEKEKDHNQVRSYAAIVALPNLQIDFVAAIRVK